MQINRDHPILGNVVFLLLLLAFAAGVFFDVKIEMKSLFVTAFGLILFPVLFVVLNMGSLNRRFPLAPTDRPGEAVQPGTDKAGEADRNIG
jgi:hypothetical protein